MNRLSCSALALALLAALPVHAQDPVTMTCAEFSAMGADGQAQAVGMLMEAAAANAGTTNDETMALTDAAAMVASACAGSPDSLAVSVTGSAIGY